MGRSSESGWEASLEMTHGPIYIAAYDEEVS
jgi:hypothetical protein